MVTIREAWEARVAAAGSSRVVNTSLFSAVGVPLTAPSEPETPPGRCQWCLWPLSGRQQSYCSYMCGSSWHLWKNGRPRFGLVILRRDAYVCKACGARPTIRTERFMLDKGALEEEIVRVAARYQYPSRSFIRSQILFQRARTVHTIAVGDQASGRDLPDLSALHVDHIVPFSKGGKTTWANCQTLCKRCNLRKGNRDGAQLDL